MSIQEQEKHRRIRLAMYAYAYECEGVGMVSDKEFDELANKIDINVDTDRPDLDVFWETEFSPITGMWIHNHPEFDLIRANFNRLFFEQYKHKINRNGR